MAVLTFNDLEFIEERDEKSGVKVVFLRLYYFYLSNDELTKIGGFKITQHSIEFDCSEKKAVNKFNQLLEKGFAELKCSINGLRTVYVHKNSGIPLIGSGVFGLIDRNTNCLEVKPLTACNLDCVFCSVDAGKSSIKVTDYIIEKDYLVEEFNKLAARKEHPVEAHIGPQGEPLLYAPLVELIRDLKANPKVKIISVDTNGTLLTEKLIDELAEAGLTRINFSLNSLDEKKCSFMAGTGYNLGHILRMIEYASKKLNVLIAPVIVPGMNDGELKSLVEIGNKIKLEKSVKSPISENSIKPTKSVNPAKSEFPVLGIQNYLNYKRGRNPVKQRSWEEFFEMLKPFEKDSGLRLRLCKEDFGIKHDAKLEKPFDKKQVVKARIVCEGPLNGEKIGVYKNRSIIIEKAGKVMANSLANVKIIRSKHNIYRAVLL
jgi:uncharacterized Fe-S cluster-containing radical SAM superfamily enzyme